MNASAVVLCYRPRRVITRPACRACGHAKTLHGQKRGRPRFACQRCYRRRRALRTRPELAAALAEQITATLPSYLTPDERADAAQSIILDILAGQLAPDVPAPRTLRKYATAARALTSDRFRFVSLSQPTRDGREFGDTLAA